MKIADKVIRVRMLIWVLASFAASAASAAELPTLEPTEKVPPVAILPGTRGILRTLSPDALNALNVQIEQRIQLQTNIANSLTDKVATIKNPLARGEVGGELANAINALQETKEAQAVINGSETASPTRVRLIHELVMSLTRPVWLLCNSAAWPKDDVESWRPYIDGFTNKFPDLPKGVGRLQVYTKESEGGRVVGTAIQVSPELIITNRHVLDEIVAAIPASPFRFPTGVRVTYNVSAEYTRCNPRLEDFEVDAKLVVFAGEDEEHHDYVVISIAPDPRLRPIAVAKTSVAAGDRVAVIGYPAEPRWQENHMSQPDIDKMFSPPGGFDPPFLVKRVSPGKILPISGLATEIAYDANTFGGNSGSGVFKISDGTLIALHAGGINGENGVQSYNLGISVDYLVSAMQKGQAMLQSLKSAHLADVQ